MVLTTYQKVSYFTEQQFSHNRTIYYEILILYLLLIVKFYFLPNKTASKIAINKYAYLIRT